MSDPKSSKRPNPTTGITQALSEELLIDRKEFVKAALTTIKRENPSIHRFIIEQTMMSSNSDLTLNFLLLYYEIFARSGRSQGSAMLTVEESTVAEIQEEVHTTIQTLISLSDVNGGGYQNKQKDYFSRLASSEVESSEELAEFWTILAVQRANLFKRPGSISNLVLEPVYHLADIFQRQEKKSTK